MRALQLFGHPFSSYCWKVLIALAENRVPFAFRMHGAVHPDNVAEWVRRWPLRKMPVLADGDIGGADGRDHRASPPLPRRTRPAAAAAAAQLEVVARMMR
jgi:hypothetical protein